MRIFTGAVFDLDGLLIDSEPIWRWAQEEAFAEQGLKMTEPMKLATTGMRLREAIEVWCGYFPGETLDEVTLGKRLRELVSQKVMAEGEAMPGAVRALELCRAAGCRLAVASSSTPDFIANALRRLDMTAYFEAVVSAESMHRGKPHPDVYLAAADALGIDPADCIAFEDSLHGLRSAKAAGMHCVAVPEAHNRGAPGFAEADRVLASLEDFRSEFLSNP